MKSLYKYISMFFVGMAVLSSCADENEIVTVEKNEPERTVVRLIFQQQADREVINSRATDVENKLYDLHFYVFNTDGKLTGYEQLSGNIESPGPVKVSIRTKTGRSYIYAVANINSGSIYKLSENDKNLLNVTTGTTTGMDNGELEAIVDEASLTHDQFLEVQFNRTYSAGDHQNISPTPTDDIFMMSGYLNDGALVTIVENGIEEETDGIIKLYRILAKNTLTIESSGNGEFTPKSYRLCNVPISGVLVPGAGISMANDTDADYTETTTGANVESSYQLSSTSTSFTFYYPENLQGYVDGIDLWKAREENSYTTTGSKVFTNAPSKAAYIEILGDYVDESNKVTANVSYTIHLGNFSGEDRLGDYNVIRNNHYFYTVKVNGVNDIIAEAKIDDDNPYAEGLVIKVGESGEHLDVDAHYESRVLTFKKESLLALIEEGTGYILNINTPFGRTKETVNVQYKDNDVKIYSMTGNEISMENLFEGEADYRWMKFVKNTTENKMNGVNDGDISKYPCKYPGDNGDWLNVFELLAELYKDAIDENNTEDEVYYTCFIDENYYASKSWSEYVNQEPRTMQIANNLSVSLDKKSVYAEVAYSISQRSIATFYTNTSRVAYGTEIIDEEDKYNVRLGDDNRNKYTYYNNMDILNQHDWDGWTSASETNKNQEWYRGNSDNITTYTENIQPLYKAAAKACMSRNRDSDGDGKVDSNEVKWYLASVGQYRGLYFAQDVLPADARLISEDELEEINGEYLRVRWTDNGHNFRGKYHYYTSSDKGSAGTFWPEEGLTNNPVQASWGDSRAEMVRCVRTLASNEEGLKNPDLYYTYDSGSRTFNLDGIKVNRGPIEGTFGVHNEIEDLNEFYTSFEVASSDYNNGGSVSMSTITGGSDPCANYGDGSWRTPNQKELALMLAEIPTLGTNNQNYGARTKFSGNDDDRGYYNWHNSPGFMTSGKVLNLAGTGTSGKIRCVRDKK